MNLFCIRLQNNKEKRYFVLYTKTQICKYVSCKKIKTDAILAILQKLHRSKLYNLNIVFQMFRDIFA